MLTRTSSQRFIGAIGLLAIATSLLLGSADLPRTHARNALVAAHLVIWLVACIVFPVVTVRTGMLFSRFGTTYRHLEPARFWTGLATYTIAYFVLFAIVSFVSFVTWVP